MPFNNISRFIRKKPLKPELSIPTVIAAIVSVITVEGAVFLWLQKNAGISYRDSYLSIFGIRSDLLPWNEGDISFLGYFAGEKGIIYIAIFLLYPLLAYSIIAFLIEKFKKSRLKKNLYEKPKINNALNSVFSRYLLAAFMWIIISVTLTLMPIFVIAASQVEGKKDACRVIVALENRDIEYLNKNGYKYARISTNKKDDIFGVIVSCSEKFCGVYSPVGPVYTQILPMSNVAKISILDWKEMPIYGREEIERKDEIGTECHSPIHDKQSGNRGMGQLNESVNLLWSNKDDLMLLQGGYF